MIEPWVAAIVKTVAATARAADTTMPLREVVARAIHSADVGAHPWATLSDWGKRGYFSMADTVLDALVRSNTAPWVVKEAEEAAYHALVGTHGVQIATRDVSDIVTAAVLAVVRTRNADQVDALADVLAEATGATELAGGVRYMHGADCTTPGGCYYHDAARAALNFLT